MGAAAQRLRGMVPARPQEGVEVVRRRDRRVETSGPAVDVGERVGQRGSLRRRPRERPSANQQRGRGVQRAVAGGAPPRHPEQLGGSRVARPRREIGREGGVAGDQSVGERARAAAVGVPERDGEQPAASAT